MKALHSLVRNISKGVLVQSLLASSEALFIRKLIKSSFADRASRESNRIRAKDFKLGP